MFQRTFERNLAIRSEKCSKKYQPVKKTHETADKKEKEHEGILNIF